MSVDLLEAATAAAQSAALQSHRLVQAMHGRAEDLSNYIGGVPAFVAARLAELSGSRKWQQQVHRAEQFIVAAGPLAEVGGVAGESFHAAAANLARKISMLAWNAAVGAYFAAPDKYPEPIPPVDWVAYWPAIWQVLGEFPLFDLEHAFAAIRREAIQTKQRLNARKNRRQRPGRYHRPTPRPKCGASRMLLAILTPLRF